VATPVDLGLHHSASRDIARMTALHACPVLDSNVAKLLFHILGDSSGKVSTEARQQRCCKSKHSRFVHVLSLMKVDKT
jgi:hypothetical protein